MSQKVKGIREEVRTFGERGGQIVIFRPPERGGRLEVCFKKDTLWLSLNQIAEVFERDKSVISRHLRNVFEEKELDRTSTVAFFATAAADGK